MLALHDIVRLKHDRPDLGVTTNHIGAVIDILDNGAAYTVEFVDEDGDTIEDSIYTHFTEDELVKV